MKHENVVKVINNFDAKIAESLIYRNLVDMVERNGITKKDITIGGTKKRRVYGFSTLTNLGVTDEESKNLDRSVAVEGQGLCMIVEYTSTGRLITNEDHIKKLKKEMAI